LCVYKIETTFKGCSVDGETGDELVAGGAVSVTLRNGGTFLISDNRANGDATFVSCEGSGKNSYGGGIAIYLEDGAINYKLDGSKFSFSSCSAEYGRNIYIDGKLLENVVNRNTFSYNYDLSNENDLKGADNRVMNSLIPLRKYLCPLTYPGEDGEPEKTDGFDCKVGCYEYLDICYYECPKNTKASTEGMNK
jgi:hypothetical protein